MFAKAEAQVTKNILGILSSDERAFYQATNLDKSMFSVSQNVHGNRFYELKQLLSVMVVESFDKYLDIPTIIGKLKMHILNFVKESVWKKHKGWKEKSISREGWEVFIKAAAHAIHSYVMMTCFLLSDGLCDQFEGKVSKFYWGCDVTR